MTEADEQQAIDFICKQFSDKIKKLNERHKHIQITGFKIQINHPTPVKAELAHEKFFKKLNPKNWNMKLGRSGN